MGEMDRATFARKMRAQQAQIMREGTETLRQELIEKQTEKEKDNAPTSCHS